MCCVYFCWFFTVFDALAAKNAPAVVAWERAQSNAFPFCQVKYVCEKVDVVSYSLIFAFRIQAKPKTRRKASQQSTVTERWAALFYFFLYENVLYFTLTMRIMPICGMLSHNITKVTSQKNTIHIWMDTIWTQSIYFWVVYLKDKVYRTK